MKTVAVYTDYSSLTDEATDILREFVSENIKGYPEKLRNGSVCVRAMLKIMLKRYFDVTDFIIDTDENGKPYIKDSNIHFNFSHSDGKALCAVSSEAVGCDVQSVRPFSSRISARYYRDEENRLLLENENKDENFIKLWTLKEAILKQKGVGLSGGLDSYGFSEYIEAEKFEAYGLNFKCLTKDNFCYAICSGTDDIYVSEIDIEEFIKNLM